MKQRKLGKKKKKKFGVDTRKNISIKDKDKSSGSKAKLDKLAGKLTSYTDNKDLSKFAKKKDKDLL